MYLYPEKMGNRYRPFLLRGNPIHINFMYEYEVTQCSRDPGTPRGPRLSFAICC